MAENTSAAHMEALPLKKKEGGEIKQLNQKNAWKERAECAHGNTESFLAGQTELQRGREKLSAITAPPGSNLFIYFFLL